MPGSIIGRTPRACRSSRRTRAASVHRAPRGDWDDGAGGDHRDGPTPRCAPAGRAGARAPHSVARARRCLERYVWPAVRDGWVALYERLAGARSARAPTSAPRPADRAPRHSHRPQVRGRDPAELLDRCASGGRPRRERTTFGGRACSTCAGGARASPRHRRRGRSRRAARRVPGARGARRAPGLADRGRRPRSCARAGGRRDDAVRRAERVLPAASTARLRRARLGVRRRHGSAIPCTALRADVQ